ncbi:MAG: acyl-CoA desaturase [Bacteroidia bacterium]|nr:acyl-CoA desaturase [Bacteroidia bacterium]
MKTHKPIRFATSSKGNEFFSALRQRVDKHFKDKNISKHANAAMVIKTIILLTAYLVPFAMFLLIQPSFWMSMLLWTIMGFALAGIGMSVMHDANHGAYSSNKTINSLLGHTLNLLGGSVFNWKLQHNVLHHTFTNIVHMDDDIDDKLVLRFSPHTNVKWYHKFQWVYAFFFYGILTLYWVLLKDLIQFINYTKRGVNPNTPAQNRVTFIKMTLQKIIYFMYILVLPVVVFHVPILPLIFGFLIMHFIAGLVLTTIFQLAHTVDGTTYPLPDANNTVENNWAIHQMNTTVNFSRKSKLISWYVGGLNFQVEHHLFPLICHVHYPEVAEIVKATAEEYGVPYLENKTFNDAMKAHMVALRKLGRLPDINEALA